MAYSDTHVDINRGTSGVVLPKALSENIFKKAVETSAIMQLARKTELPGSGISMNISLGDAEASWVGETEEIHVGENTIVNKTMTPHKLAVILTFSKEFKRDLNALYNEIAERLPEALAKKFDKTVLFGNAPGSGFDTLASSPTSSIASDKWGGLVGAYGSVADAGGELNGWAISPKGKTSLLGATDENGRPLFVNGTENGSIGSILSAPTYGTKSAYDSTTHTVLVGGDWSMAAWGTVGDIEISITEEATINDGEKQINLWQRDMFAVKCEVECAFVCADDDYFVRVTDSNF